MSARQIPATEDLLALPAHQDINSFIQQKIQARELSGLVKALNARVLCGDEAERNAAIDALRRLGFWLE